MIRRPTAVLPAGSGAGCTRQEGLEHSWEGGGEVETRRLELGSLEGHGRLRFTQCHGFTFVSNSLSMKNLLFLHCCGKESLDPSSVIYRTDVKGL